MKTSFELFAVCPPGLEEITAYELKLLGFAPRKETGGVSFRGDLRALYRANLWLRTPARLLVRVGEFHAQSFGGLVSRVARYPWEIYFPEEKEIRIRVTCRRSRLYHSGAVAERVLQGIARRLSREIVLSKKEGAPLLVVRLFRDRVLLRVDSSGLDLFKRGYKVAPGPAPLRENLAAALLFASGWDRESPLLDPFCGTGTIPIEAALMASNRAPGLQRSFAFERWKNFVPDWLEELRQQARESICFPRAPIFASDMSAEMVEAACQNARAAQVEEFIHFEVSKAQALRPPVSTGYLVTNPPYGERLKQSIYHLLGKLFRRNFGSWKIFFLAPERDPAVGLPLRRLVSFEHGGLKVHLLHPERVKRF